MSLTLEKMNNLAFNKARLNYASKRASRWWWVKSTNHDVAFRMSVDEINKLILKVQAYDKRSWLVRGFIRLFTNIRTQRELLIYRLSTGMMNVLGQPNVPPQIWGAQRKSINIISGLAKRASLFSWFRRSISEWCDMLKHKINASPVLPSPDSVEAPRFLDTPEALEAFRANIKVNIEVISESYNQGCERLIQCGKAPETVLAAFDETFAEFRELLRVLKRYYHPDKVNEAKANQAGLTLGCFKVETELAIKEINPIVEIFNQKREELRVCHESLKTIDEKIALLKKTYQEMSDVNSEFNRRVREALENYKRDLDAYAKRVEAYCENADACIKIAANYSDQLDIHAEKLDGYSGLLDQRIKTLRAGIESTNSSGAGHSGFTTKNDEPQDELKTLETKIDELEDKNEKSFTRMSIALSDLDAKFASLSAVVMAGVVAQPTTTPATLFHHPAAHTASDTELDEQKKSSLR